MQRSSLECALIKTIAYYALFAYPLTLSELAYWLNSRERYDLRAVWDAAERVLHETEPVIGYKNGLFFLSGREASAHARAQNFLTQLPKIARARRAARLLSWVPFVRLVCLCNTVALATASPASDIDFFIVARAGRLWTVRLLTALLVHAAGWRRHGSHIANRICLSFYLSDGALDLSRLRLPEGDIYLTYWPTQLVLLYDARGTFEKFNAANAWVNAELVHADMCYAFHDMRTIRLSCAARAGAALCESLGNGVCGDWVECICKKLQLRKMRAHAPARAYESAVVINDDMLKFHEQDRRREFHAKWTRYVQEYAPLC